MTITLQAPFDSPVITTTIQNPEFKNTVAIQNKNIPARAVDGTFYSHVIRSEGFNIKYIFEGVARRKALEVIEFIKAYHGQEILLTDWNGTEWKAIISNSSFAVETNARHKNLTTLPEACSFTIEFYALKLVSDRVFNIKARNDLDIGVASYPFQPRELFGRLVAVTPTYFYLLDRDTLEIVTQAPNTEGIAKISCLDTKEMVGCDSSGNVSTIDIETFQVKDTRTTPGRYYDDYKLIAGSRHSQTEYYSSYLPLRNAVVESIDYNTLLQSSVSLESIFTPFTDQYSSMDYEQLRIFGEYNSGITVVTPIGSTARGTFYYNSSAFTNYLFSEGEYTAVQLRGVAIANDGTIYFYGLLDGLPKFIMYSWGQASVLAISDTLTGDLVNITDIGHTKINYLENNITSACSTDMYCWKANNIAVSVSAIMEVI